MKCIDLTGCKFGQWTVLNYVRIGDCAAKFECKCSCGEISIVRSTNLRNGKSTACRKCLRRYGSKNKNWKGESHIPGWYWRLVKLRCKKSGIKLLMSIDEANELFLKQNGCCMLTGIKLIIPESYSFKHTRTASLDRIDSKKDYTIDNTQWIHKDINWMKNTFNQDYFIQMCNNVYNFKKDNQ